MKMDTIKPPKRIRTGDFDEPFARAANKRRQELQPVHLAPRLRPTFASDRPPKRAWYRKSYVKSKDDENPEHKDGLYNRPIQAIYDIPVSCRRVPFGSRNALLFLTTREGKNDSPRETRDIRWLQMQHSGLKFEEFANRAVENANVTSTTKSAVKDWLLGLQSQLETSVFAGMAFPGTAKGSMFGTMAEGKNLRVKDTCLFFTFPYFLLSDRRFEYQGQQNHPVRALVQTLYRNESPFSREFRQIVNRLEHAGTSKVIYVPQIWCLIVNDDYLVTCSPSQLHTRPTSYIATVAASEYPASVRLRLRWGLTFSIKLEECKSWFEFLLRVHHIYSHVLRMHVDAERCTYWHADLKINHSHWASIVQNKDYPGSLIDIRVLLPEENTGWNVSVSRTIQQEYVDTSGLGRYKVNEDDVDDESIDAFGFRRGRFVTNDEYEVDCAISPALMDRITEHTETRRALQEGQYTPTRSDSPIRTRRRRDIVRIPPTVSRYYETRNSSASSSSDDEWLTSRRRGVISNVVDTGSPNRRRRPLIRSDRPNRILWRRERYPSYLPRDCCSWPGCYSKYKQPLCRDALNDLFWNSSKATQTSSPELADDDVQAYLSWPVYVSAMTDRHGLSQVQDTEDTFGLYRESTKGTAPKREPSGDADTVDIDDSPASYVYRSLSERREYSNQEPKSKVDLDGLMRELKAGTSSIGALVVDASTLIDHFIPSDFDVTVKEKAYGALYGILEKCGQLDRSQSDVFYIYQVSSELGKALLISECIREGVHGHKSDLFLLNSFVEACILLVLALTQFNKRIPAQEKVLEYTNAHIDGHDRTRRITRQSNFIQASRFSSDSDPETENIARARGRKRTDVRTRTGRASRPSSPFNSESETHSSESSNISINREDILRPFEKFTSRLSKAKEEVLQGFESRNPLNLAAYSTVNSSGIIASIITSIIHGDCDLTLPLGPENAYLSSMFTTSASGGSNSVIQLDLGALYQDYCSKLRLIVRERPARNLLDDLDLAEEELDSIIKTSETQQEVIKEFLRQSFQRQPTQNAWVGELNSAYKILDNKIGVYEDLKVQIDKLRRQITLQLELKEDTNSKAIMIFTIVTVIFLPLSFVTGYLGMNTVDIRDMDFGQWVYWASAVPLTILVVTFCMTLAYQGHKIQEYVCRF